MVTGPLLARVPLLPTTVVGSYPVPDWMERLKTDYFRGPGKYDGSVVNWVNGPLLAHVGRRHGLDVHYEAFRHRSGGNIVTMTAQARD